MLDLDDFDAPPEWRQADLFTPLPPKSVHLQPLAKGARVRNYGLRYYQEEAKQAAEEALSRVRSALIVMATGTGKTTVFGSIAGDWPGDVLVLAHREELIAQAAQRLERMTGEAVGIEKGPEISSGERLVVASFDSMSEARCKRLGASRFSLIICDECHHALAPTYRKVLEFFMAGGAKLLGVTATPDRGDEKALGQMFEEVAYLFDIADAIEAGYLVPIEGHLITVEAVDLSGVDTRLGDLVQGQLDVVMVEAVEGIVKETLRLAASMRGIVFWPGVKSAELADLRFNALDPGSSCFVHGKTNKYERPEIVAAFKRGETRLFNNVAVATEGFDDPTIEFVGVGRPTKSRNIHCQICGRGLRPLPGVVDHIPGKERAAERRAAIAASAKPVCHIFDFVGNSGRHALMAPEDLLGGNYSESEVELAKKKAKEKGGGNALANLEAARAELRAIAAKAQSKVKSTVRKFDPFEALGIEHDQKSQRFGYRPATEAQRESLLRMGFKENQLTELSKYDASKLLDERARRHQAGLASYKQMSILGKYGVTDKSLEFPRASRAIDYISANGWKVQDPNVLHTILYAPRTPGEEG